VWLSLLLHCPYSHLGTALPGWARDPGWEVKHGWGIGSLLVCPSFPLPLSQFLAQHCLVRLGQETWASLNAESLLVWLLFLMPLSDNINGKLIGDAVSPPRLVTSYKSPVTSHKSQVTTGHKPQVTRHKLANHRSPVPLLAHR